MKEYVPVPPKVLAAPVMLKGWFAKCLAYAQNLPAKPTSKKLRRRWFSPNTWTAPYVHDVDAPKPSLHFKWTIRGMNG